MRTRRRSPPAGSPSSPERPVPKHSPRCSSLNEGNTMAAAKVVAGLRALPVEAALMRGVRLTLETARHSPKTVGIYLLAVDQLATFAAERGVAAPLDLSGEHIRE